MGWETRRRGGRYYTRSRKVGGRVVRQYVGGGPAGDRAAAQDAAARAAQRAAADRLAAETARLAPVEAATIALSGLAEALARAALVARGYRQHHRGAWRKRRNGSHG